MEEIQPVFIIGCPRSGTTVFQRFLAAHNRFAWVSDKLNQQPDRLEIAKENRLYDLPLIGIRNYIKRRPNTPHPVEPWNFWNHYLKNFQWQRHGPVPPRRRTREDIFPEEIERLRSAVNRICVSLNKGHFLSKYTDFPRIVYLRQVFPNAKFIHLVRDGRAVAFSYYNRVRKGDFATWEERDWWIKGWPEEWRNDFLNKRNNPLGLVTYQWKFFLDEIWADAETLPGKDYLEISYEDFIARPQQVIGRVLDFSGLRFTARMKWFVEHYPLADMNRKWREKLAPQQIQMIHEIITEKRFANLLVGEQGMVRW
ncbi:MAG: sulfotransferase [Desulfobacterales bacterium]|nr:sulfotransferase [Desulfobacterales bacterium]